MKALQLQEPKKFVRVEIDSPAAPTAGMALVRTHRMGICGTDYSCYLGKFPFFDYPRIPGHELGVEVLEGDGELVGSEHVLLEVVDATHEVGRRRDGGGRGGRGRGGVASVELHGFTLTRR